MTKDEILNYLLNSLGGLDSKETNVTVERNKDKLDVFIRDWNGSEKFQISVKRME